MKLNYVLTILLVLAIAIGLYYATNQKIVDRVVTEYKYGKPDTVFLVKYTKVTDTVYKFSTDTVKIDSNGSKSFTTAFNIAIDSLTGVKGNATFREPLFEFSNIELWFPERTISTVDTLTYTITESNPFYDTFTFGFAIGILISAISILLLGA